MLFVLIPIAWLTIVALVLNACRAAARGDRALAQPASSPRPTSARVLWNDGPALRGTRQISRARGGGFRARDARGRSGRCAAGS